MPSNVEQASSHIFNSIVKDISECYESPLTQPEATEAARNLIGFCRTLVEMYRANKVK